MTRIIYNGKVSPCRIKAGDASFDDLKNGDILDIGDSTAKRLLKNKYFSLVTSSEKKVEESVVDYDLNNDGVFDSRDKSIAGKVLSASKNK